MSTQDEGVSRIIEAAQAAVLHKFEVGERTFVVMPSADHRVEEIKPRTPPLLERTKQNVRLDTKDSFCDYVSAYGSSTTRLFADLGQNRFVAVMDYHSLTDPGATEHRATYCLQESEQWARWKAVSGKLLSQADFVRFLEENCTDFSAPSAAELHEICRDFSAKRRVDFREAVRLDNGARQFEFVEEIKGTSRNGEIEVPSKFVLQIPIYYGEAATELHAFLRYAIDGALVLGVELHRPKFVQQAVFESIGRDIAELTVRPLHYGALE